MTLKGGGLRRNSPGIAPSLISFLSMVALEESVGGAQRRENSLHWKANMLPLFSIMTLCFIVNIYIYICVCVYVHVHFYSLLFKMWANETRYKFSYQ